jgi:hypothetical protein
MPVSAGHPGPGEGPDHLTATGATGQSLGPVVNEYGKIKLSIDALGMLDSQGDIHVDKPSGGKVRKAYLLSATTGFTDYQLADGDVMVNGTAISWEKNIPNSISSYNYWADVTSIVKPTIDAAPAGIVTLQISEQNSLNIDGEILAVIFDDPNQTTNSTVILYFGAQNITGDTFTINTGRSINTKDPNLKLDFSLGISYGYCPTDQSSAQYSQVDVNGQRSTTSAGCQDDGESANGALITAGGIGDSDDNPADPYATPINPRSDDELYSLKPFVKNNDTTIKIDTINPSNDDNIFFAALILTSTSTIQTIDVDISLASNPTTAEEKAPYENIIRYFADAVFEESNGINKLGTVTFHPNGDFSSQANIVWGAKGWPNSDVAGYGTSGKHTNMYDIFQDGGGKGIDYDFMADDQHQRGAGYTLGHEFGHLYYSLYDEYQYSSNAIDCALRNLIFSEPHCTDKPVKNSIMNSQWNALFSNNYNWLNFSIYKNTSGDTAQYRVYGAAGWDTLTRPVSQDPPMPWWSALPVRLYHSELASVKPGSNADSRIDLPGTARSELSIVWESSSVTSSKSMQLASSATSFPYTVELHSTLGQNISYPDPIVLEAFVHQDLDITDLNVTGNIILPDGSTQTVQFADDGVSPDVLEGDGIYSAILNYTMNGMYTIQVTFDNHALSGKLVAYGSQMSTDINGDSVPYPDPQPVTDDFELSQSLLVSVGNVVADDHGNTPDLATEITTDDAPISGKIDYAGDADVFKITTLPAGLTYIRVTNLAFGITPHVRVLAADKITVLYQFDQPSTGEGNYLGATLADVQLGTTVYVEVTDKIGNFGGLYRFSAGTPLTSDSDNAILTISGNAGGAVVILTYIVNGNTMTAITDKKGKYLFTVPYGWSGTVVPSMQCGGRQKKSLKKCYFTPSKRIYDNLQTNKTSQDYKLRIAY